MFHLAAAATALVSAAVATAGNDLPVSAQRAQAAAGCHNAPPPVPVHPIRRRQWVRGVTLTEYYPVPERWFVGRRVHAPGLPGRYASDFLYSVRGVSMEGTGVDRHGRRVHFVSGGSTYWVNLAGRRTDAVCLGKWTRGIPAWLRGGWRNRSGQVTFPLRLGGWSNGRGVRALDYGGVTFGDGPSEPLSYYRSIAVDPRLIPFGSRVYIPAYRWTKGHGWFRAVDIGGAIKGKHIDIYRPAPADMSDQGRYLKDQRVLVVPPR